MWMAFESRYIGAGTVANYLYGLQHFSLIKGHGDPLASSKLVKKMLRAIQASDATPKRAKRSVTFNVLRRLKRFFDFHLHDHRCLWAMFCLAVTLLLRIGEAVPRSVNAEYTLRRRDWSGGASASLFLRKSKCDKAGAGILLRCPNVSGKDVSAVGAMAVYIKESTVLLAPHQPLFVLSNGKPLTRGVVVSTLRQAADLAGLGDGWDGISFRKGGALSLALAGVEDRVIKGLGRWTSTCFKRYIRLTDAEVSRATQVASEHGRNGGVEWRQPFYAGAYRG